VPSRGIAILGKVKNNQPLNTKKYFQIDSRRSGLSVPLTWTTFEQSTQGECETKYEMIEMPESMARSTEVEEEKLITRPEMCSSTEGESSKVYQLTKVRNLNNCVSTPVYSFYKPGKLVCPEGFPEGASCGGLWTRSSITRYTVCGTPDRFLIQSIINEGEINQSFGYKSEDMLTGTRQVMKLISKSTISRHVSEQSIGSKIEHSLSFKHSSKEQLHRAEERVSKIEYDVLGLGKEINKEKLIRDSEELIKQIVNADLFTKEGLPEKEISFKVLALSKAFKHFDMTMLHRIYENLVRSEQGEKTEVIKNILVDTIIMSGTPDAVRFFKHLVERNELPTTQIAAIFFNLPRSIMTPTRYLLEELYELVISEPIRRHHYVYSNAVLAYSNLLQNVCLEHNRESSYPVKSFGKICNKESGIITEKWIPYLQRELVQSKTPEKKNLMIVSLGLLSHEQILPVILPVIEEEHSVEFSRNSIHMARYLAVYSLVKVGRQNPELVLPIVSALYTNTAEPTDIRIAAFNSILGLKPDMTLLQKIASLTWTEKDTEVLRAVNTAFYTLSREVTMQDFKLESSILIRRVRLMYPLIKKTAGAYPTTSIVYANEFLPKLNVGYERINNWIGSENSVIPSYFYEKITLFMGQEWRISPLEVGVHFREVFPNLYDTLSGTASSRVEEVKSKLTTEWRETIEKLRIKVRENSTPEAYIFMNLFEDSTIFHSFSRLVPHFKAIYFTI
jgi:hypothetical protein